MVVKRYSNRRLYDTDLSRYVTIDEVAERIRGGMDLAIVDAPTGDDITQIFLAQIILEGRGAARLLPVPLLYRLIRMGDDALADFFGRYVTWALDVYLRLKQGARTMAVYNPLASMPMAATDALARWLGGLAGGSGAGAGDWRDPPPPRPSAGTMGYPPPPPPGPMAPAGVAEAAEDAPTRYRSGADDAPASSAALAEIRAELEAIKASLRASARRPPDPPDET